MADCPFLTKKSFDSNDHEAESVKFLKEIILAVSVVIVCFFVSCACMHSFIRCYSVIINQIFFLRHDYLFPVRRFAEFEPMFDSIAHGASFLLSR